MEQENQTNNQNTEEVKEDEQQLYNLKVKTMDDQNFKFHINKDTKISKLKQLLQQKSNIEPFRQRLIYQAKELKDDKILSDYAIFKVKEDNQTVHMMAMSIDQARERQNRPPQEQQYQQQRQNNQQNPLAGLLNSFSIGIGQMNDGQGGGNFQMYSGNNMNDLPNILNQALGGFAQGGDGNTENMDNLPNFINMTVSGEGTENLNQLLSGLGNSNLNDMNMDGMSGNINMQQGNGDINQLLSGIGNLMQEPPPQQQQSNQENNQSQSQQPQSQTQSQPNNQQPQPPQPVIQTQNTQQPQQNQQAQVDQPSQARQSQPQNNQQQQQETTIEVEEEKEQTQERQQQQPRQREQTRTQQVQTSQRRSQRTRQNPPQSQPQQDPLPQQSRPLPRQGPRPGIHVMRLQHERIHRLQQIIQNIQGPGSQFPGPPIPSLGLPQNSLTNVGTFLYNYTLQMQQLTPIMEKLSLLLQRENRMVNPVDRSETQLLANQIGQAMEEVTSMTGQLKGIFSNLQMGNGPGEFRFRPMRQQRMISLGGISLGRGNQPPPHPANLISQFFQNGLNQNRSRPQQPQQRSSQQAQRQQRQSSQAQNQQRQPSQAQTQPRQTSQPQTQSQPRQQPPQQPQINIQPDSINNLFSLLQNQGTSNQTTTQPPPSNNNDCDDVD